VGAVAVTARAVGRSLLVVVLFLLVQSTIGVSISIDGAHPDIMWLLPIAAGVVGGPDEGALMGFLAGIAADLLLPTPFGLSALVGCLVGFGFGATTGSLTREVWWFPSLVALASSAAAVMLYAVLGAVLGQDQFLHVDLVAVVVVVALFNALLAPVAIRIERWVLRPRADGATASTAGRRW